MEGRIWTEDTLKRLGELLLEEFGVYNANTWVSYGPKDLDKKEATKSWDYIFAEICRFNTKKGIPTPNSLGAVKNIYRWAMNTSPKSFSSMPAMCRYTHNIGKAFVESEFFDPKELDRIVDMSFNTLGELCDQRIRRRAVLQKMTAAVRLRALRDKDEEFMKWIEELKEIAG